MIPMGTAPIFIGGLARSGKTLLRQLLSSHPNILMTRRTYIWRHFFDRFGNLAEEKNFERCLSAMMQRESIRLLMPEPDRIRREFWQSDEQTYARLFSLLHEHYAQRLGKTRWGEQEGSIEQYAAQIFGAYPNARMIHMIRDPRSLYSDEVKLPSRKRLGKVGSITGEWVTSVRFAEKNLERFRDKYKLVRIEDLLNQPEETMSEISDFINEDVSQIKLILDGAGDKISAENDETMGWTKERVHEYLSISEVVSPEDLVFIENYAGEWMLEHGYLKAAKPMSLNQYVLYYFRLPANFMRLKKVF